MRTSRSKTKRLKRHKPQIAYIETLTDNTRVIHFNYHGKSKAKELCIPITAKKVLNGEQYKDMDTWIEKATSQLTENGFATLVID